MSETKDIMDNMSDPTAEDIGRLAKQWLVADGYVRENVLTIISKRVERGERVDVRDLYIRLRDEVDRLRTEVD